MARTSISIDPSDLKWLRAWARKHHGGNLSAAVADCTKLLRQHENRTKVGTKPDPEVNASPRKRAKPASA